MTWCLRILGTSSATPTLYRNPSAHVLVAEPASFLIDCGEATQIQMLKMGIKRSRINHIFLSHLHGDHIFGLPGLLSSYHLDQRTKPLHIYGPLGTNQMISAMIRLLDLSFTYSIEVHDHSEDHSTEILRTKSISVSTIPLKHRIPTTGYLFKESISSRKMIGDKVEQYHIPFDLIAGIKEGDPLVLPTGKVVPNHELTEPNREPYTYAYCSDTLYDASIADYVRGVDLLYHEATFLHEQKSEAMEKMHSTAVQAATLASYAEVHHLLLGHFSARYREVSQFQREAQKIFGNTHLAIEGQQWHFEKLR